MQVSEDLSERLRGFAVYHLKISCDIMVKQNEGWYPCGGIPALDVSW